MQTPSHPLVPTRRVGQVISISNSPTPTVEVQVGADPSVTQFVPYLDVYDPAVNDYVVLLGTLGDYVVIGAVEAAATSGTFTPTWTASAGTPPAVGNGTIGGWFGLVSKKRCNFDIQLTIGTTTTGGSSGTYTFGSLPFAGASSREQEVSLKIIPTSGGTPVFGFGTIVASNTGVSSMWYQANSTGMSAFGFSNPVLGTGGHIHVFGTYETA